MAKRIAAFSVLLFAGMNLLAGDANPWQFALPTTKAFIGINWRRIAESPAGRALAQQLAEQKLPIPAASAFLKDVDEVLIASPGRQPGDPEDIEAPVLIRLSGHFRPDEIQRLFMAHGARVQSYNSRRVFRQKKDGDMAAVLLDDRTLLLGDAESLFAALNRLEWPATLSDPLVARAEKLRADSDVWALFTTTPEALAWPAMPALPLLEELRGMELGIGIHDGLDLRVALETESEASAGKLVEELRRLLKLTARDMQRGSDARRMVQVAEAAKKIQISPDKTRVQVTLRLSAEELQRSIQEAVNRRRTPPHRDAVAITITPAGPPPRQTIRIEGLDEGPREIRMPGPVTP